MLIFRVCNLIINRSLFLVREQHQACLPSTFAKSDVFNLTPVDTIEMEIMEQAQPMDAGIQDAIDVCLILN